METKGTVTSLSSLLPAEEAQKASRRVQDTITERRQQLGQLKGFLDDNIGLINLVQKLPDETHHNIMVPFGKAAFFPGRLIHTNEFMVLLGEGYYVERTSKQTVEILKRRGKVLETQVESLKAIMQDLKAEASFFDTTAYESAEGLVEIREDYVEEGSSGTLETIGYKQSESSHSLEVGDKEVALEDEEYARLLSRLDELQKEEEQAEKSDESGDDEQIQSKLDRSIKGVSLQREVKTSQVEASVLPAVPKGGDYPSLKGSTPNKALELPKEKKKVEAPPTPIAEETKKLQGPPASISEEKKKIQAPLAASNMAFTGSIVEHVHNVGMNSTGQAAGARSSKPVSRFKMQRK